MPRTAVTSQTRSVSQSYFGKIVCPDWEPESKPEATPDQKSDGTNDTSADRQRDPTADGTKSDIPPKQEPILMRPVRLILR